MVAFNPGRDPNFFSLVAPRHAVQYINLNEVHTCHDVSVDQIVDVRLPWTTWDPKINFRQYGGDSK